MLRNPDGNPALGGQHPPECQSNQAPEDTFSFQNYSGIRGSICSGISISLAFSLFGVLHRKRCSRFVPNKLLLLFQFLPKRLLLKLSLPLFYFLDY